MQEQNLNSIFSGERYVPGIEDSQLELEHYQRYYSIRPLVKGKYVLDAACGEGYGTSILADSANNVIGIDISKEAIQRANRSYANKPNIQFLVENVTELSLPTHSVDVVVSFETIEHISEDLQSLFLQQIARVLKEDGILVMSTPNKAVYTDLYNFHNEYHIKEFYKEEFISYLKHCFKNVLLYDQYFEVASIIDRPGLQSKTIMYCKGSDYQHDGKYYIALASNSKIPPFDITHVYMNKYPEYEQKIFRILQLQDEVEKRNAHLKILDNEISNCRTHIEYLENTNDHLLTCKKSVEKQNCELIDSQKELQKQLMDMEGQHSTIQSKLTAELEKQNDLLRQLTQTNLNLKGHIEQLLEVEREYEREKKSRTYRLALKFRQFSTVMLPLESKRRFFAKVLINGLSHPVLLLKMVNLRRLKNCFVILKAEGVSSAFKHYALVQKYERAKETPSTDSLALVKITPREKCISEYKKLIFHKVAHPLVSIVIPVYNQFDYTYHCLEAILNNSEGCEYEVLVANDCSTDLTERLEQVVNGITVINTTRNLGFLLNCNYAAQYASGKYLVFLNNDTQVQPNWLPPLTALLENHSSVGLVGSKLIYSDGYLQEAGGILWKDASAWNYGNRQNPDRSEFNYVHEADYISGAAIIIRKNLWDEIGGFDTRYAPAYCEDSDLAFEVRRHGYQVLYQPASVVVHFEGVSNGTDLAEGLKKYQVENQKKFFEKWKTILERDQFENGVNVFLARDRSRRKKHVLFIDHYVPQYDKDAGSKTTFMYLKMLTTKGFHITFWGDNFYRDEPYTFQLQQMGILVLYGPEYAEDRNGWLSKNAQYFDIFYLNRPHITIKYIDLIKRLANGKIIYYGHDFHYLRLKREYDLNGNNTHIEKAQEWLKKELYIMHQTDMNYYPSNIECCEISSLDSSIPVKSINAYIYDEFPEISYHAERQKGLLFVGGFGHSPNLDAVFWFLNKIYPTVYRQTHAPFYIVGSKAPKEISEIEMEGVVVKGFVTEDELQQLYRSCRISVVPLRYGAGVKGKVVESLYYGIPVVTTSVGAEGIRGIENIAVVQDNETDLADAICSLYNDYSQLAQFSRLSQEYIKTEFSMEAAWNIIRSDFEQE